jgi:hypothetical protein
VLASPLCTGRAVEVLVADCVADVTNEEVAEGEADDWAGESAPGLDYEDY